MRTRIHRWEHGVECIEGVPGSGKSLMMVRRLCDQLDLNPRPVYTNLPLVWPVMRQYLRTRGGPRLVDMVRNFTLRHFMRFCARRSAWEAFRKERVGLRVGGMTAKQRRELVAAFDAQHGPPVLVGDEADWLPSGSMLIIDEIQDWFDSDARLPTHPDVVKYLSKHRHHCHWIWVSSQDETLINISFRRVASCTWVVHNKAEDRLAYGLKLGTLGLRAIGYQKFTGDQRRKRVSGGDARPVEEFVIWTQLPSEQVFFKLYHSYTHVGSARALEKEVEGLRLEAGLSERGVDDSMEVRRRKVGIRMFKWIKKWVRRGVIAAALLVVVIAAALVGHSVRSPAPEGPAVVAGPSKPAKPERVVWGKFTGFSGDGVRVEGKKYAVGASLDNGARIVHVSRRSRGMVLERDGRLFTWRLGEGGPVDMGTLADVAAVRGVRPFDAGGGRVQGGEVDAAGAVGDGEGLPVGGE